MNNASSAYRALKVAVARSRGFLTPPTANAAFQVSWTESTHRGASLRNLEPSPGNFAHRQRCACIEIIAREIEMPAFP